jgi:hypothetical protein
VNAFSACQARTLNRRKLNSGRFKPRWGRASNPSSRNICEKHRATVNMSILMEFNTFILPNILNAVVYNNKIKFMRICQ